MRLDEKLAKNYGRMILFNYVHAITWGVSMCLGLLFGLVASHWLVGTALCLNALISAIALRRFHKVALEGYLQVYTLGETEGHIAGHDCEREAHLPYLREMH